MNSRNGKAAMNCRTPKRAECARVISSNVLAKEGAEWRRYSDAPTSKKRLKGGARKRRVLGVAKSGYRHSWVARCQSPFFAIGAWDAGNYFSRIYRAWVWGLEGVLSMCSVQTGGCEMQAWERGLEGYWVLTAS